jgi:hypothetical protein
MAEMANASGDDSHEREALATLPAAGRTDHRDT